MENESKQPEFCINNCGFYGNQIYKNMCSKCFKEQELKLQKERQQHDKDGQPETTGAALPGPSSIDATVAGDHSVSSETESPAAIATAVAAAMNAATTSSEQNQQLPKNPQIETVLSESTDMDVVSSSEAVVSNSAPGSHVQSPMVPLSASVSGASTPTKRLQANKGRCFKCRARIPLVKQTTNKCRCDFVFCDTHRFPDQHDCEFDHMAHDRLDLEKKNPKLNTHRKAGRSFTRID